MTIDWLAALDGPLPHEVVVLPETVDDEGNGIYRDELITFAKDVKSDGVDAGYVHDADHRTWSGRKGEALLVPILISLGVNFFTDAVAFGLAHWLTTRFVKARVHVRIVHKRSGPSLEVEDIFEATGPAAEVAAMLRTFESEHDEIPR